MQICKDWTKKGSDFEMKKAILKNSNTDSSRFRTFLLFRQYLLLSDFHWNLIFPLISRTENMLWKAVHYKEITPQGYIYN